MDIDCPSGGMYVKVHGAGSGSGGGGTICVRGTDTSAAEVGGVPKVIRVRVVPQGSSVGSAEPKQSRDVDVVPTSQTWVASPVLVSSSSTSGVPMTVAAWIRAGSGSWAGPTTEDFFAGGTSPTDCCAGPALDEMQQGVAFKSWTPPPPPFPPNLPKRS